MKVRIIIPEIRRQLHGVYVEGTYGDIIDLPEDKWGLLQFYEGTLFKSIIIPKNKMMTPESKKGCGGCL